MNRTFAVIFLGASESSAAQQPSPQINLQLNDFPPVFDKGSDAEPAFSDSGQVSFDALMPRGGGYINSSATLQ